MKLLESGRLEALSSMMSNLELGEWRVLGRVESYSCKVAGSEQKGLYKKMAKDGGGSDVVALSPPLEANLLSRSIESDPEVITSENMDMFVISRKRLFNLISTLNLSFFPDYDFSDARSHEFSRSPSLAHVWAEIDSRLSQSNLYNRNVRQKLWEEIDNEIGGLRNSEIYTYKPDFESDPFSESGCVWSFNFFFYNPKIKRIVFLTCRALSPYCSASEDSELSMED